jgi:hypothetical protein
MHHRKEAAVGRHSVESAESRTTSEGSEDRISEELARVSDEPFLAVERNLVVWSLILGVGLLGVLIWVSSAFFAG